MRFTFCLAVILSVSFALACKGDVKPTNSTPRPQPTPVPTFSAPKDGNYNARGRVTKINLKMGSVEINHEDIPGVMPPMQMEFNVRDKTHLGGLKVGDTVDFVLEYKYPTETIIGIKKIQ